MSPFRTVAIMPLILIPTFPALSVVSEPSVTLLPLGLAASVLVTADEGPVGIADGFDIMRELVRPGIVVLLGSFGQNSCVVCFELPGSVRRGTKITPTGRALDVTGG